MTNHELKQEIDRLIARLKPDEETMQVIRAKSLKRQYDILSKAQLLGAQWREILREQRFIQ